ncbi:MAG: Sulfate transport system permease protein CysW [Bacteroidetes bacterium ADurb.Bin408]|nr:MAG: Sulfate transport system permease protein CysW [Bacteroidetes bacterium ADurb.Bin408]
MKNDRTYLIFSILGGLVLLFIIAPLLSIFLSTSFKDVSDTIKDSEVTESIWLTIFISMVGTILFALGSIPLAYLISRKQFFLKRFFIAVINLPIVIPHSAAGIALLSVLSRNTLAGKFAGQLGFEFVSSPAGIMLAMSFVSIPYLITSAIDGFNAVPVKLERAAMNLGASPWRAFFTIALPLAWRPILSGLILMWARGMSEFGAVIIIAYHPITTPVLIWERFNTFGLQYAKPVSLLFICICLAFFIVFRLLTKRNTDARG